MYYNELTIVFNVIRSKEILGDSRFPHIIRIPQEEIHGSLLEFLKEYQPLSQLVSACVKDYPAWKSGTVMFYCIQKDTFFDLPVQYFTEAAPDMKEYCYLLVRDFLEEKLNQFNDMNHWVDISVESQVDNMKESLRGHGLTGETLSVLFDEEHKEEPDDVRQEINKILCN